MVKKSGIILLLLLMTVTLSGCIPPFFDGGIAANEYFAEDVVYTTYTIDAGEPGGYVESVEGSQRLEYYTDVDEKNIALQQYKSIAFTTKSEGIKITALAFIVQAENECNMSLALYYGEDQISSERFSLGRNTIQTAYFSELSIVLLADEKLSVVITNPLEVGLVSFRTDSYIFIGEEV